MIRKFLSFSRGLMPLLTLWIAASGMPAFSQMGDMKDMKMTPGETMAPAVQDAKAKPEVKPVGDPYSLPTDAVTGEKLTEKPVVFDYKGRELRVNAQESVKTFNANPDKYIKAIDAKMIAAQLPFYPLETCVVSGQKLGGDMGKAIDRIYNNRLVRFCCADCPKEFAADPAKFMKKLDAAVIEKQGKDYPFDHCLIQTDEKFGPDEKPRNIVIANQLVEVCCAKCQKMVYADPLKYIGMVKDARIKAGQKVPAEQPSMAPDMGGMNHEAMQH